MTARRIIPLLMILFFLAIVFGCSPEKKEEAADTAQTSNQSGQITPVMQCQGKFEQLDTNKDGKVSYEEFIAISHPGGQAELIFKARDKDVDGFLTVEEFCQGKGLGRGPGARKQ